VYVADADATPIVAIRRKNEALQAQCDEHNDLLQSLVSVTEADALVLLARLREGDSASSVTRFAENMQRHHMWRGLNPEALFPSPSPASNSPMVMATPSDIPQTLSPVSLEPPAASPSRIVFEPRIDVVPAPPNLLPKWYVWCNPVPLLWMVARLLELFGMLVALSCGIFTDSWS
jgi:hypothetical protein